MLNLKVINKLFRNATPIISSSLGLVIMGATDTVVIAWLGESALAAQSLAGFIHMAIFMTIIAFIFPVANIYHLNQSQCMPVLKTGLLFTVFLALLLTIIYWMDFSTFTLRFLSDTQQPLFDVYFKTISFTLLPGSLFFYCRMLLYTEEEPKQIGRAMVICIILNAVLDLWALHTFQNPQDVIRAVALITLVMFILLAFLCNAILPLTKRIQSIIKVKTNKEAYRSVIYACAPAGFTSLAEYGFFAVLALMVAYHIPQEAAMYRVILQIEEMLIIIFYALARVLSFEISSSQPAKPVYMNAMMILFITLMCLPLLHPFILKIYHIPMDFSYDYFVIIILLLFTETLMLYACSVFWGYSRYTFIAVVTAAINWGLILPLLWLFPPTKIEGFYYALILNYTVITLILSTQFFVFKRRYNYGY